MLESLFSKVAGLQDRFYFSLAKTLKNFINFLINYLLLRNVQCSMLTEVYLELSRTSTMEVLSLRLSHILKTSLIRSCCFRFHFLHKSPFREKIYNSENFGRKSLVNNRTFYFRNSKLRNGMASSTKVF